MEKLYNNFKKKCLILVKVGTEFLHFSASKIPLQFLTGTGIVTCPLPLNYEGAQAVSLKGGGNEANCSTGQSNALSLEHPNRSNDKGTKQ